MILTAREVGIFIFGVIHEGHVGWLQEGAEVEIGVLLKLALYVVCGDLIVFEALSDGGERHNFYFGGRIFRILKKSFFATETLTSSAASTWLSSSFATTATLAALLLTSSTF